MIGKQPKKTHTLGQFGEKAAVILYQLAVNCLIANSLENQQRPQGSNFTREEVGLAMSLSAFHRIIKSAEQFDNKILGGHDVPPSVVGVQTYSSENLMTFFH